MVATPPNPACLPEIYVFGYLAWYLLLAITIILILLLSIKILIKKVRIHLELRKLTIPAFVLVFISVSLGLYLQSRRNYYCRGPEADRWIDFNEVPPLLETCTVEKVTQTHIRAVLLRIKDSNQIIASWQPQQNWISGEIAKAEKKCGKIQMESK